MRIDCRDGNRLLLAEGRRMEFGIALILEWLMIKKML